MSKVSASSAPVGATATGWVTPAGRHGLSAPIDPLSMAGFTGVEDSWRRFQGESQRRSGGFGYATTREAPYFTPLVGRMAAAFPANEVGADGAVVAVPFLADLRRAVMLYESNMRINGDTPVLQGGLVNRYS